MAINLPNVSTPGQSFQQGFKSVNDLFDKIRQHQFERQKLQEAVKQHADLIKFKMLAEKRANEDSARKQGLYGERLKKLKHENADDEYFDNAIGGGNESSMPNEGMRHEGATSQTEGINNRNTGILNGQHDVDMNGNPVGGGEPQQPEENVRGAQSESPVMKMIKDRARKDPKFRALYTKKYKVDPLAALPETSEEKEKNALDLFKKKASITSANKGGDNPTEAVLTQNQQAIQGITTVIPMLDELIAHPDKVYGRWDFNPSKKATYNAKTSGMIDTLVAAQSLPKVQASIDLVEEQIKRQSGESTDNYIKRIKDLREDLVSRLGKSQNLVRTRKVSIAPLEDFSKMSDEELHQIARGN